jgi:hypothetical protein
MLRKEKGGLKIQGVVDDCTDRFEMFEREKKKQRGMQNG